jgi:hypothetical protein
MKRDDRMTVLTVAMTKSEWAEAVCALHAARNLVNRQRDTAAIACSLDLERISTILERASTR